MGPLPLDHHRQRRCLSGFYERLCHFHGCHRSKWLPLCELHSHSSNNYHDDAGSDAHKGILFCEYWLVKHHEYDTPALYDPDGIYRYWNGVNWRALLSTLVVIVPLLPALAKQVIPQAVTIDQGL